MLLASLEEKNDDKNTKAKLCINYTVSYNPLAFSFSFFVFRQWNEQTGLFMVWVSEWMIVLLNDMLPSVFPCTFHFSEAASIPLLTFFKVLTVNVIQPLAFCLTLVALKTYSKVTILTVNQHWSTYQHTPQQERNINAEQGTSDTIYACIHKAREKDAFLSELITINLPLGLDANAAVMLNCDSLKPFPRKSICTFFGVKLRCSHINHC